MKYIMILLFGTACGYIGMKVGMFMGLENVSLILFNASFCFVMGAFYFKSNKTEI